MEPTKHESTTETQSCKGGVISVFSKFIQMVDSLHAQNLSGREDVREAFNLGIKAAIEEFNNLINYNKMKLTKEQLEDLKKIANENIMVDHNGTPFFLDKGIEDMVSYIKSIPFTSISNEDRILSYSGNSNPFSIVIDHKV